MPQVIYLLRRDADLAQENNITMSSNKTLDVNDSKLYPALSNKNHSAVEPTRKAALRVHFLHNITSATASQKKKAENCSKKEKGRIRSTAKPKTVDEWSGRIDAEIRWQITLDSLHVSIRIWIYLHHRLTRDKHEIEEIPPWRLGFLRINIGSREIQRIEGGRIWRGGCVTADFPILLCSPNQMQFLFLSLISLFTLFRLYLSQHN